MKKNKIVNFRTLLMGGLMVASLTACSTADEVTDNKGSETVGIKFTIDGTLPTDNSRTRSGSLVDNDTHTGGMNFKWLSSTDKMTAVGYCLDQGLSNPTVAPWGLSAIAPKFCVLTVNPDGSDNRRATLETTSFLSMSSFEAVNGTLYCIQNASNLTFYDILGNMPRAIKANLIMPANNVFTQTEQNSSAHLSDYLFIKGKGDFTTSVNSNGDQTAYVQNIDIPFHTSVATIRLKVTNKQSAAVIIKSITIKSAEKLFPGYKVWDTNTGVVGSDNEKHETYVTEAIIEPTDQSNYTATVTAQCGTEGFEVASDEALYNYVAVHQHDEANALAGKTLDFVITTADGKTYTAYNFECDKLEQITGNKDFVAGYTYTFTLSLKENKLTLGNVTVNEWGTEIDGGNADITAIPSLTDWCKDDTYKAQREALTTLTLNGETITETEATNYTQGDKDYTYDHFKTYFPNVTTVNFTGTAINAAQVLRYNQTVKTIIGKDLVTLGANAMEANSAVTSYDFPNVEKVGYYCFNTNGVLTSISLPKLKTIDRHSFDNLTALDQVCFASMYNFTGADDIFCKSNAIKHLAFGTTEPMIFLSDAKTVLGGPMASGNAAATTLYLNEDGYEYKYNVSGSTWRGITFNAIKKYSEYPGKKD